MARNARRLVPQDFELFSGNDKVLRVTVRDENGGIVDLTGATIRWILSRKQGSTPLIDYTSPTNITLASDPATGKFDIEISDTDSEPLRKGTFYHECLVTSAAGLKTTVMYGFVEVLKNSIV